ncbi:hypothetical protein Q9L58_010582 [Maublancomyces gigas]|uniref:Uncharacterized protein n=1 Tax=Discina gigas TaxID=1032678 RepID=A0ABR3G436_9PEZI
MTSRGSHLAAAPRARESEISARDIKVLLGFGPHNNHGYLVLREYIKSDCMGHGVMGVDQPKSEAWLGCVEAAASYKFLSRFRMAYNGAGPKEHCKLVQKAIRNLCIDSIKKSNDASKRGDREMWDNGNFYLPGGHLGSEAADLVESGEAQPLTRQLMRIRIVDPANVRVYDH